MPQTLKNIITNIEQPPRKHRRLRHHFIAAWLKNPLKIGAIVPSSRGLARAMAEQVDISREGAIIELGAGTGMVTHALMEAEIPKDKLIVIEREKPLFSILHSVFHDLNVLCEDAMELDQVLEKQGVTKINAIVSSLPFITMPTIVRHTIQEKMAQAIGKDGIIIQFTYGHRSPINPREMKRYGLVGRRVKIVFTNVPPAHVWVYRQEK